MSNVEMSDKRCQMTQRIEEHRMKSRYLFAALLAMCVFSAGAVAQQRVKLPISNKEWEAPFAGFKIVGNMYYVGAHA